MFQGQTHLVHFFLILQFSGHPPCTHFPKFQSCIMLYAKPWEHSSAVATPFTLSSCQLESTLPPAAQLLLSQSQLADLVRHHLRLSNVCERISQLSCEPLYMTNTSHPKQEIFLYEYPVHGRHFDYWNQPLNVCMRVYYLDCHEAGLCCHLVIHTENVLHPLQLFYSICDLFTDSPSYI
jgi:hypothetical protein